MIFRTSPFLRRCFAAFAAVTVLLAPATQVAHAQAMLAHAAAECSQPAMAHHQMASPSHHTQQHQHGGSCCEFCSTGCATAVLLPSMAAANSTPATLECVTLAPPTVAVRIAPAPHLLPFSQAPPTA